ncbi:MAG: SagB family peptide dehydrogenase [Mycobacteriaceae bacterium]
MTKVVILQYSQDTFALREGAKCVLPGNGFAVLLAPSHQKKLLGLTPEQVTLLKIVQQGSALGSAIIVDQETQLLTETLLAEGWLTITVRMQNRDLYTLQPFAKPPQRKLENQLDWELSKFSILHKSSNGVVLEHPQSWCDIELHDAQVVGKVCNLPSAVPDLPTEVSERLISTLRWTGHIVDSSEIEDSEFATRSWSAHELWFHRHSNMNDRVITWNEFGPTRWAESIFPPVPARKIRYAGNAITLAKADLDQLRRTDLSLTSALEERVSCRDFHPEEPISIGKLGELLYRTCRTREIREDQGVEYLSRPYPSGGAVYELEIYPVIHNVAGLASGMYHYDSFEHLLRPVAPEGSPEVDKLLRTSSMTLTTGQLPQVLLVISARTGRLMWTYQQVSYGIILKHVGILLQTIYLTATAMGLGAVAQGYADTTAFTSATGVKELEECSVGSIVIGTPA